MSEHERIVEPKQPDARKVAAWIGPRNEARWTALVHFIEREYPGVFETTWLFAGKKHGWSLRFKKSKSFCTLIPERGRLKVLLVFGGAERGKVDAILPELVSHVREDYEKATTFHDGRWVSVVVDNNDVIADVERLLRLKRAPKSSQATARGAR